MGLFACWVLYPLLLAVVAQGCGALVALAAGRPLPAVVRLPCGIALAIAVLDLFARAEATAKFAVWAVAVLTVAGWIVSRPRPHRPSGALVAALIAFGAYAAPIVLSGMATWAGYIKLDDTATWLALVDRALSHGHSIAGLAPSTYQAALAAYLVVGYPLGSFLPLGLGHVFLGEDIAWLTDPWMAFMGAMIALALYRIASLALPTSRAWQRALIAGIGAQPALLYAYYLWGGMKEMCGAMLICAFAVTAPLPLSGEQRARALIPVLVVTWAMVAALSPGGLVWLGPGLVLAALPAAVTSAERLWGWLWRPAPAGREPQGARANAASVLRQPLTLVLAGGAIVGAVGAYLVFRPGGFVQRFHTVLTSGSELGNLVGPLSFQQLAGIWPTGDFRYTPMELGLTRVLVGVVAAGAAGALVLAIARRRYELSLLLLCAVVGASLVFAIASPWLGGKALATGSVALPFGALIAAGYLAERDQGLVLQICGGALALLVAGGVLWSNLLGYHAVSLAPRPLMQELSAIGGQIAGQGPTFLDEYAPYAARHFLRAAEPESASELRTRLDPLINGQPLGKGGDADIDQFELSTVLTYRTLVLQRSPSGSRPPSPYRLVIRDRYWDVWQRPQRVNPPVIVHMPLGDSIHAGGVPVCSQVAQLAQRPGVVRLVAAPVNNAVVVAVANGQHPATWSTSSSFLTLDGAGTATFPIATTLRGRYMVWLGGSIRGPVTLYVDGHDVGTARYEIMEDGQYVPFGNITLAPGSHTVTLKYGGGDWRPGSGGPPDTVGPFSLSLDVPEPPLVYVSPANYKTLCGRTLDWIEGLGART